MQHKDITIHRVASADNLADIFTKPLLEEVFLGLRIRLGMRKISEV
jgi:hypothetical protein